MLHNQKQTIALSFAAMTQHGVILLLVGPMLPNIMATFEIGESVAGLLLGMGSLGFVVGPLIAGAIIDRLNVRAALVVGLIVEIVVLVLFGLSPAFFIAVICNFLLHFGSSFLETGANYMPTMIKTNRSPHALMNLVHMFFSIGAFLGPLLIGLYIDASGRWRPIMFFTLIPTAALLLWSVLLRFPRRDATLEPSAPAGSVLRVLRTPYVLLGALSLLLYVGAEVGISSWVVYYLQQRLAFSPALSGAGLSVLWVAILVGRYLNSLLGNAVSSTVLVTVSCIAGAVGVGVFLLVDTAWAAFLILIWIGLCLSGMFPNVMGELNNREPKVAGTVTAVMAMGAAVGAALFQWLVGYLAETVSLTAAFATPAILQIALIASFLPAVALAPKTPAADPAYSAATSRT
jgi:fucose permease